MGANLRASKPVSAAELRAGEQAIAYVEGLIRGPATPTEPRTLAQSITAGTHRMERMKRFLDKLGVLPLDLPVVHVAGTSGKGTVATKIAAGLTAAGYRTGLHCTPYLQTALEKFVLDGQLARPRDVVDLVEWIRPHVEAFANNDADRTPTYGMVWVAMTFEYFRRQAVDVLVLEVGAGGRFDLTNVVTPALTVITSVGLDHRKSLGGTLEAIAWHKAGVLKNGTPAVIGFAPEKAHAVLKCEVAQEGILADWSTDEGPPHDPRVANTGLAERALQQLYALGFTQISNHSLLAATDAMPPARFEWMPHNAKVVLDGAHNPDKTQALAQILQSELRGRPIVVVAGVVGYRSARETLAPLLPYASAWIATEPRVYGKPPARADQVVVDCKDLVRVPIYCEPDPWVAVTRALEICPSDGVVAVAGSLYLAGNIREHWYPTEDIVRSGTMWPRGQSELRNAQPILSTS